MGAGAMKRYRPTVDTAQVVAASRRWIPDSAVWFMAVIVATWARFDFEPEHMKVGPTALVAAAAVIVNGAVGGAMGIYRRRYIVASFEECLALATVAAVSSTLLTLLLPIVALIRPHPVPRSVPVLAGAFALGGILAVRWLGRTFANRHRRTDAHRRKVVILGAGRIGQNLTRQMQLDERV